MSHELVSRAYLIEWPSLPMQAVFMKLADCADPDGTNVFPSVATIADECTMSESCVRVQIAALREMGLLIDRDEAHGNRSGRTTVLREIDIDKLALITGQRVRGKGKVPSTHVIRKLGAGDDARWAIILRPTPPGAGGVPLQEVEGYPSTTWTPPLQEVEGTPPGGGPNPSIDPSMTLSPLPPAGGAGAGSDETEPDVDNLGTARGRRLSKAEEIAAILASLRQRGVDQTVIAAFVDPLLRQRRVDAPDPAFALAQWAEWVCKANPTAADLGRVLARVLDKRRVSVKPVDLSDAWKDWLSRNRPRGGVGMILRYQPGQFEQWDAWKAWAEANRTALTAPGGITGSVLAKLMSMCTQVDVPAPWPPGDPRAAASAASNTTEAA